jgi:hypothetical protein
MITGAGGIASYIRECGGSSPHAKNGGAISSVSAKIGADLCGRVKGVIS